MSTRDVFQAFIEAEQALTRLPELEAAHEQDQASISALKTAIAQRDELELEQRRELADLKAEVRRLAQELDDSRFRELEISDRFETLVTGISGSLRKVDAPHVMSTEQAKAVDAEKESPMPDMIAELQRINEANWAAFESESQSATPLSSSASPSDVIPSEEHVETTDASTGPGQVDDPSLLTKAEYEAATGQSDYYPTSLSPSAPSTDYQSTDAGTSSVEPLGSVSQGDADDIELKRLEHPYLGRPHWVKPSHLSWDAWEKGGGDMPLWMRNTG